MSNFSVLISLYNKENPLFLKQALDSVVNQTIFPNEIVIVKDGLLGESLENILLDYDVMYPNIFKFIQLPVNKGLGNALSIGVLNCSYDLIARMDTDDICVLDRFERQIDFFNNNPNVDLLGSNIEEFNIIPGDLNRFRRVPEKGIQLINYSKYRNPINHPTIMFRKDKVIAAGNYQSNLLFFEDYSLYIRMIKNNFILHNIQDSLLFFRVGRGVEMIKRRSGFNYLLHEWRFSLFSLRTGHLNYFEWIFYIITKLPFRLLPTNIVLFVYVKLLRN
jgi:glycosyltransferase involved in cell wall biosynthesis